MVIARHSHAVTVSYSNVQHLKIGIDSFVGQVGKLNLPTMQFANQVN